MVATSETRNHTAPAAMFVTAWCKAPKQHSHKFIDHLVNTGMITEQLPFSNELTEGPLLK
jgi:hypothetical protein